MLEEFLFYWHQRVRDGKSSDLSSLEVAAIRCFIAWQEEQRKKDLEEQAYLDAEAESLQR